MSQLRANLKQVSSIGQLFGQSFRSLIDPNLGENLVQLEVSGGVN